MKRLVFLLWPLLVLGITNTTVAGELLRAEFFPQRHHFIQGKWKTKRITRGNPQDSTIVAKLKNVELRLQIPTSYTMPPQAVSIYMVLPLQIPGMRGSAGFEVSWKTRKVFQAGTARPGDRVLLYQGTVSSAVLSDFVSFKLTIDSAEMLGTISFEPSYEIERR
jgi:hypothetical protein